MKNIFDFVDTFFVSWDKCNAWFCQKNEYNIILVWLMYRGKWQHVELLQWLQLPQEMSRLRKCLWTWELMNYSSTCWQNMRKMMRSYMLHVMPLDPWLPTMISVLQLQRWGIWFFSLDHPFFCCRCWLSYVLELQDLSQMLCFSLNKVPKKLDYEVVLSSLICVVI